jgi:hypothetical protein
VDFNVREHYKSIQLLNFIMNFPILPIAFGGDGASASIIACVKGFLETSGDQNFNLKFFFNI